MLLSGNYVFLLQTGKNSLFHCPFVLNHNRQLISINVLLLNFAFSIFIITL
jgi:hypothetical protein